MTKFDSLVKNLLTESNKLISLQKVIRIEPYPTGSRVIFSSNNYLDNESNPEGNVRYYKNIPTHDLTDLVPIITSSSSSLVRHRLDGPAILRPRGAVEYWIDNMDYTEKDYWDHPSVILYRTVSHLPPDQIKQALDMLDI